MLLLQFLLIATIIVSELLCRHVPRNRFQLNLEGLIHHLSICWSPLFSREDFIKFTFFKAADMVDNYVYFKGFFFFNLLYWTFWLEAFEILHWCRSGLALICASAQIGLLIHLTLPLIPCRYPSPYNKDIKQKHHERTVSWYQARCYQVFLADHEIIFWNIKIFTYLYYWNSLN